MYIYNEIPLYNNNLYMHVCTQGVISHLCLCSFATGLEFREASLGVSPKCVLSVAAGMVFNINLGFAGLSDGGKQYALFIGDTVLVNEV